MSQLAIQQAVAANEMSDLEKTMKNIGLAYKQSVEATQLALMARSLPRC